MAVRTAMPMQPTAREAGWMTVGVGAGLGFGRGWAGRRGRMGRMDRRRSRRGRIELVRGIG